MKPSNLASVLAFAAILAGCESSTSSRTLELPGAPDPALAGNWRSATGTAGSTGDTMWISLTANGAFSSTSHQIYFFNGSLEYELRCAVSGNWSVDGGRLYSGVSGSCTETEDGKTTTHPVPLAPDTARYVLQGSTLQVIHTYEDANDTMTFSKL